MRVLSVFGTRPEAVKMAPVVQALAAAPDIESKVCVTAQHREMLDQVLQVFSIQPHFDLDLMRPDQCLTELAAEILLHINPVLKEFKPDWVLVQGDTTTVMAVSLACFYNRIHVGHVEAGLRTGNRWQPFPEEINRKIAGVTADLHLAPTEHARRNLLAEGVADWRIVVTGNPVIDALRQVAALPVPAEIAKLMDRLEIGPGRKKLILVTAHRRENFGEPLEEAFSALKELAHVYRDQAQFVYPVHLNPNVQEPARRILNSIDNFTLLPAQDYLAMVHLMKKSTLVLTDSGGIQEEATSLGIPTLVMRSTTERPEGVEAGVLKLVGTDREIIVRETRHLLDDPRAYAAMASAKNPFGDGQAAGRILQAIRDFQER